MAPEAPCAGSASSRTATMSPNLRGFSVGDDLEGEVLAQRAAVDALEVDAQRLAKMLANVLDDAGFRCRGQADQRSERAVSRVLLDESGDVAVVGPEIVSPLGHAMRFVENPVAHLPLVEDRSYGGVPQLLGRDEQHRRIAEPDLAEGIVALGERQQAVDGDARRDALALEPRNLIGHQRHERRDDDGQSTDSVKQGKGRQLVAQRLARTGRKDPQDRRFGQRRREDGFLEGTPVRAGGPGPEPLEAEPPVQKRGRVAPGAAPGRNRGPRRTCRAACERSRRPRETGGGPKAASRSFRPRPRSTTARRRAASRLARLAGSAVQLDGCRRCRRGCVGSPPALPARPAGAHPSLSGTTHRSRAPKRPVSRASGRPSGCRGRFVPAREERRSVS